MTVDSPEEAWEVFCERGVIVPGYEDAVAARRATSSKWAREGEVLR